MTELLSSTESWWSYCFMSGRGVLVTSTILTLFSLTQASKATFPTMPEILRRMGPPSFCSLTSPWLKD